MVEETSTKTVDYKSNQCEDMWQDDVLYPFLPLLIPLQMAASNINIQNTFSAETLSHNIKWIYVSKGA